MLRPNVVKRERWQAAMRTAVGSGLDDVASVTVNREPLGRCVGAD
jgi:hypothetical protein